MKLGLSLKDSLKADCERRERERERERMSRDRERDRDRERERERDRDDRRDRDRRDMSRLPRHLTASADDPKLLQSRLFVGNLPTENMIGNRELEDLFSKYGKILGVNMLKGYGFVQFEREDDARIAIEQENGSLYKSYRIDVKMAAEGRGGGVNNMKRPARRPSPPPRHDRERSPIRDSFRRGSTEEPFRRSLDPVGPGPRDPYQDRDPYRREPFLPADPYREPYGHPPQFDAMLIVADPKIRGYGEAIERRLNVNNKGMMIDFNVLRDVVNLPKALEEASVKKMLYAIVVNEQNEIHRSLTLNVLHGTPQEHRNMPLDDALTFVSRNYSDYLKEKEMKAASAAQAKQSASQEFAPPDKQTSYLLNLLADNRFLRVDELDIVIDYLLRRREILAEQTGVPARKQQEKPAPGVLKDEQAIAVQQQELQQKILNILNGSNGGAGGSQQPQQSPQSYGTPAPKPGSGLSAISPTITPTSINFDNPTVKKALDNLISGGSSLLKNIAAVKNSSAPTSAPGGGGGGGMGPRGDNYGQDPFRNDMGGPGPGHGPQSQMPQHDPYMRGNNYGPGPTRDAYGGDYGSHMEPEHNRGGYGGHQSGPYGRRY